VCFALVPPHVVRTHPLTGPLGGHMASRLGAPPNTASGPAEPPAVAPQDGTGSALPASERPATDDPVI